MSEMVERVAKAIDDAELKWQMPSAEILARAAIAAMRVPTPEMIRAGNNAPGANGWVIDVENIFQAMIDEALK